MGLAVAPVSAGSPTEIFVSNDPQGGSWQGLDACARINPPATGRAAWTVDLWGGTSGNYLVTVHYGDGTPGQSTYHPQGQYDTHYDFLCGHGQRNQSWSATRSGGGTGYDYSYVETY